MMIKVCGITELEQLYELEEMNVSYAGFIFYPPSPRFVSRRGLTGPVVKGAKVKMYKVGVFVNATYDEIMKQIDAFGLDMIQLHGHETPYTCSRLNGYIEVIKAFRFAENDHVQWMIKDYYADADMFLFDTGVPAPRAERNDKTLHGGTGRKFNWNRLRGLNVAKPFILSGGIEPSDVHLVRGFMQEPVAKDLLVVDINSRFESSPGVKDMSKIRTFTEALHAL
jgi:phosphoribosylanthranilate isomerase